MSITYVGVIVAILAKLMEMGGVNIGTEQLTEFVLNFGVILGGFVALYGRFRKGDLKFWGGRKEAMPPL